MGTSKGTILTTLVDLPTVGGAIPRFGSWLCKCRGVGIGNREKGVSGHGAHAESRESNSGDQSQRFGSKFTVRCNSL